MTEFWSYVQNDKYCVGCTGKAVHLYEKQGTEVACFRDLPAAYRAVFSPSGQVFAIKSADGRIAVYSLKERRLLFAFRFSDPEIEQEGGFCFSRDGKRLLNLERREDGSSELCIYDGTYFVRQKQLFTEERRFLAEAEADPELDCCYLLGFRRDAEEERFFVSRLWEGEREEVRKIRREDYLFYREFLRLAAAGFTEKAMLLSALRYEGYDLRKLQESRHSLAELWKKRL